MHGPVEQTGRRLNTDAGRHRGRQAMPSPAMLALPVAALLAAVAAGAALLPSSLTGPGAAAERPGSAVGVPAPGAGGGAPGAGTPTAEPSAEPARTARPSAAASPKPRPKPTTGPETRPATKKPTPRRTVVAAGLTGQENEVIRLVNVERDRAGCGGVRLNGKLRTAIRLHVRELGTHGNLYISHVSDDGRDFVQRAKEQGYDAAGGENVARGQRDAADVMTSWMNSEGHRANILNCDFKAIGVGAVKGVDGTIVWGQLFGRS
ncbi:CAP domain-containing protein [Couchioplanes caeruleus]|uniref:CAP domain-containing protein n=1 Tax=Couchioplanes caeruleus TaxID=56438 RepID=UPI0020C00350|nr:CAP domain-containing protein [Couchioplanes caeruleus]UQU66213.1 CAP domain-containing protein [Couchioplanes caeruleus]